METPTPKQVTVSTLAAKFIEVFEGFGLASEDPPNVQRANAASLVRAILLVDENHAPLINVYLRADAAITQADLMHRRYGQAYEDEENALITAGDRLVDAFEVMA